MSEVWTKLRATLSLDPAEFKAGASQAAGAATSLQNTVVKAAGAMGIAFGAAEVIGFAKDLAKAADASVDAARGLGITTAALVGLQRVAARQGVDGDKVIQWMQKLEDVSADLAMSGGNSPLGKQLDAMGMSIRDFLGLPLPERLMLLIRKSDESKIGISALNASLGKGAALEAKEAYLDLAKEGLGSITEEADKAAKAMETLASVWNGGEKKNAGVRGWVSEKLANLVDMNRLIIGASRGKNPAPDGIDALAEGIGAAAGNLGMQLLGLIHKPGYDALYKRMQGKLPFVPGPPGSFKGYLPDDKPAGSTELQDQYDKAAQTRADAIRDKSSKSVDTLKGQYEKAVQASMEGEAKLKQVLVDAKSEHAAAIAAAEKKYADEAKNEKSDSVRDALWDEYQQTVEMLDKIRMARLIAAQHDVNKFNASKYDSILEIVRSAEMSFDQRKQSILASVQGNGTNADSMARVGGFSGNERPGLAVADRQLRVQEEIRDALFELTQIRNQATAALGSDGAEMKWW